MDEPNALSACVPPHDLAPFAREDPIQARETCCRRDVLVGKALAHAGVSACPGDARHWRTTEAFRSFAGRRIDGRWRASHSPPLRREPTDKEAAYLVP